MYTFLTDIADPFVSHLEYEGITQDPVQFVTAQVTCGNEVVGSISSVDFEIIDDDHVDVTFYGLQSIIAGYMKSKGKTIASFDIEYTIGFDEGAGSAEDSIDVLYNRYKITGTTAQNLLQYNFLQLSRTIVADVDDTISVYHYFPSGTTVVKIREYAQTDDGIDYNEWSLRFQLTEPGIKPISFTPSEYVQTGFENYMYWEVILPNSSIVITVYPLREKYYHHITFRNTFGLLQHAYIPGTVTSEQEKEYELGTINGENVAYDVERIITNTLSADAALPQLLPYLREICMSEDVTIDDEAVIVTEHDIPSTDTLGEPFAFSLKYQSNIKNGIDKL